MNQQEKLGKWWPILKDEFDKDYMRFIGQRLATIPNLCPSLENVFRAYELTAPEDVKVVIMGQDPYHTPGMAHGLSFSTLGSKLPPSLRVIFDELVDSGLTSRRREEKNLTDWAEQGVLLLNSVLTTETGKPLAHGTWGWQKFTGKTIEYLATRPEPTIFMMWGANAFNIVKAHAIAANNNHFLESYHPAAQLYGRHSFVGNRHFIKANEILVSKNLTPIIWGS